MRKLLILLFLLSILFISSGQTYEQQSLIPTLEKWLPGKPLEGLLAKIEIPYWGITVSVQERGYYYFVEFLLRKGAHFFIFGFIATAIYLVLPKLKNRIFLAGFLTLLVAIGDEYHQSLTGGRTPTTQDVILDMAGAITALILISLIVRQFNRKKKLP